LMYPLMPRYECVSAKLSILRYCLVSHPIWWLHIGLFHLCIWYNNWSYAYARENNLALSCPASYSLYPPTFMVMRKVIRFFILPPYAQQAWLHRRWK
jgi:hypothetical protein